MSKVALRVYNRDIEALIDQGHYDEAIAHCQHILKMYPKHLETYRLLGKAYLEARRFGDAADIFQRVLMAVPDDFVSHLGMSIICDEQKDLDKAIWHMERAFEVNPSNAGVQGELRRLYGRRDGLEPPKIRLTRGALAQMYTKGGQYQQAVAEIKSVLAEDATRNDMKNLLARAYFRAGMKVEATEICTDLLKQYPYNLDGNRILVEILPGTSMAGSVDQYKRRVSALDPYTAVTTGSLFDVDHVPDTAVMVERSEYEAGMSGGADWQTAAGQIGGEPVMPAASGENIPEWMQQAGWAPSTGEFQEGAVNFDEPEAPTVAAPGPELAAAEIPDWLKAMAPAGAPSASTPEPASPGSEQLDAEDLDWLAGLGAAGATAAAAAATQPPAEETPASAEAPAESVPDWMADLGATSTMETSEASAGEELDWLGNLSAPQTESAAEAQPASAEAVPDWLENLGQAQPADEPAAAQPQQPVEPVRAAEEGLVPDWLSGLETDQPPVGEAAAEQPQQPEATFPAAEEGALPGWLSDLGATQPVTPESESAVSSQPQSADETLAAETEFTPDWLSDLSTTQPLAEEPAPAETPKSAEALPASEEFVPDWLGDLTPPQDQTPAQSEPVADWLKDLTPTGGEAESELSALVSGPGTSEAEQDEALKWLESLAAKQGAKAEELITKPEERQETIPDWVEKVETQPAIAEPPAPAAYIPEKPIEVEAEPFNGELSPVAKGPGTGPLEQDEALKWLETLAEKQGANPEELITPPAERIEEKPVWVDQIENPPTELSALVSGPGTSESEQDDALKWLESLAAKQGAKAEELITNPDERTESAPEWVSKVGEEPESVAPAPVEAPQAPVTQPSRAGVADDNFVPGPLSDLVSGPGTSESEQDDALKWLESLAAKQGAKPEELITNPEERIESAPEWVAQVGEEPVPVAPVEPVLAQVTPIEEQPQAVTAVDEAVLPDELSAVVSGPGTSESEQDDALKWLESLAAKQGAKPEELITNPEERTENAPEWVSQVGVEPPAAETPHAEQESQEESLAWLAGLTAGSAMAEEAKPTEPEPEPAAESAIPDWLGELGQAPEPEKSEQQPMPWEASVEPVSPPAFEAPAAEETPAAGDDWYASLEQDAAQKPAEPMPWEQETAAETEPAAESMPWEQEGTPVTPAAKMPWEEEAPAETSAEPMPWEQETTPETPAAKMPWEEVETPAETAPAEAAQATDVSEWLQSFEMSEQAASVETPVQPTAAETAAQEEVPSWIEAAASEAAPAPAATTPSEEVEELPDWLKDSSADEQPPTPAYVSSWMLDEQVPNVVSEAPATQPAVEEPPTEPEAEQEPAPITPHPTGQLVMAGDKDAPVMEKARGLLDKGGLEAAMIEYSRLIRKGRHLEEVIYDLQNALYRHPVDVVIWQTLGDAFMRSNRLQDALDAYTKAEELLR